MSHQSLYRAYRPKKFSDIAGQSTIIESLQAQIDAKKIGHAYLFSGSRGLGKTSIARIFAREIGCTEKDLYEIDAASHTGVDHIRGLIEGVYTLPFESPYKVYILDEAHMLSKGAWNALLKTLEEPPSHVVFILATTELSKVPETVLSRCQVFEFKKPSREGLRKLVNTIAKKEGYTLEGGVSDLVALLSEGSYRDALSVLEKVFSVAQGKTITHSDAERAMGAPRYELVHTLVSALSHGHTEQALTVVHTAQSEDIDMQVYLSLILQYIRIVLLARYAPELKKELAAEVGEDQWRDIETLLLEKESKLTHETLKAFLAAASRIRFSPIPVLSLEIAILELVQ